MDAIKGHQLRFASKSYTQASQHIDSAMDAIKELVEVNNPEALEISLALLELSEKCKGNAYALDEAYNQNA